MFRYFTTDHEWVSIEGDDAIVGITAYAVQQIGDVVALDLPKIGQRVTRSDEIATVETVKAASSVYAPLSGKVIELNLALESSPSLINSSPEHEGWLFRLQMSDAAEINTLIDESSYQAMLREQMGGTTPGSPIGTAE